MKSSHTLSLSVEQSRIASLFPDLPSQVEINHLIRVTDVMEILDHHRRQTGEGPQEWKGKQQYAQRLLTLSLDDELSFVLPGFPVKSPNKDLVLGSLPDEGERIALKNMHEFMQQLSIAFGREVKLTIFSDGSVFSDILEVPTTTAQAYHDALKKLNTSPLIEVVSMKDYGFGNDFEDRRERFLRQYAEPLESLRGKLEVEGISKRYNLFSKYVRDELEGKWRLEKPTITEEEIQARCLEPALRVLQRSMAYGKLIEDLFPEHLRLSVHPHSDGDKLGINLVSANDGSETPWHNVTMLQPDGRYELMSKNKAVSQGATLVFDAYGHPSHYRASR